MQQQPRQWGEGAYCEERVDEQEHRRTSAGSHSGPGSPYTTQPFRQAAEQKQQASAAAPQIAYANSTDAQGRQVQQLVTLAPGPNGTVVAMPIQGNKSVVAFSENGTPMDLQGVHQTIMRVAAPAPPAVAHHNPEGVTFGQTMRQVSAPVPVAGPTVVGTQPAHGANVGSIPVASLPTMNGQSPSEPQVFYTSGVPVSAAPQMVHRQHLVHPVMQARNDSSPRVAPQGQQTNNVLDGNNAVYLRPSVQQQHVAAATSPQQTAASLPPIPAEVRAFASLPPPTIKNIPPIAICQSDLLVYEYIAKRARATADSIDASLAVIRAAQRISGSDFAAAAQQTNGKKQQVREGNVENFLLEEATRIYTQNRYGKQIPNTFHAAARSKRHRSQKQGRPQMPLPRALHDQQKSDAHSSLKLFQARAKMIAKTVRRDASGSIKHASNVNGHVGEVSQQLVKPGLKAPPGNVRASAAKGDTYPWSNGRDDSSSATEKDDRSSASEKNNLTSAADEHPRTVAVEATDSPNNRTANVSKAVQAAVLPPGVHTKSTASLVDDKASSSTKQDDKPSVTLDRPKLSELPTGTEVSAHADTNSPDQTTDDQTEGKPVGFGFPASEETETSVADKVITPGSRLSVIAQTEPRFKTQEYQGILDTTWDDIFSESIFVDKSHIGVPPDAILVSLAQFKLCALTADDRIGRYKHQEIGWVGICCKHCYGQPGYGRYFPSTAPSFVSSFTSTCVSHIGHDCMGCPQKLKLLVKELDGSQQRSLGSGHMANIVGTKSLMDLIWKKMRTTHPDDVPPRDESKKDIVLGKPVLEGHSVTWSDVLDNSKLVKPCDHCLVPDSLYATLAQMESFEMEGTTADGLKNKARAMGLQCRHCKGADGAKAFPTSVSSIATIDTTGKILIHMTQRCNSIRPELQSTIMALEEKEKSESRRYASREEYVPVEDTQVDRSGSKEEDLEINVPLDLLVEQSDSCLVYRDDKGMVSETHYLAFSQLKPCRVTVEDQCGWYKDREVGYPGVCCIHCGGRPSSGRYFPKTGDFYMRSSRNSVVKHLIDSCQACPDQVRDALTKLHKRDKARSGWKVVEDSTIGSGKQFYERIFRRLYHELQVNNHIYADPAPPGIDDRYFFAEAKRRNKRHSSSSGTSEKRPRIETGYGVSEMRSSPFNTPASDQC